jgi:hypothetical protein
MTIDVSRTPHRTTPAPARLLLPAASGAAMALVQVGTAHLLASATGNDRCVTPPGRPAGSIPIVQPLARALPERGR